MITKSAARNMWGYFCGLSSPSVTEITTTRADSPRSNNAGHTRLPTFSMKTVEPGTGSSAPRARCEHPGIQVAARAGVDLDYRPPGGPDPIGVQGGLLVPFNDTDLQFPGQFP